MIVSLLRTALFSWPSGTGRHWLKHAPRIKSSPLRGNRVWPGSDDSPAVIPPNMLDRRAAPGEMAADAAPKPAGSAAPAPEALYENGTAAGERSPAPAVKGTGKIYTAHFGLRERPFALQPDPDFLFWSPQHKRAFSMLEYGIVTQAPITLITGEVGAGKTTLLQQLLRSIDEDVRIGLVSNAQGDRGELLRWVLMSLDQEAPASSGYVDLFEQFQRYLIEQYAEGRRVILIFDEAQNLARESLEELRMFTNINSGKDELLQLILVGQPELRDMVLRYDMRQFAQRVSSSYHLPSMDRETLAAYIAHRLSVAGAERPIFEEETYTPIFEATRGVPRLVNQLCDLALVYAFSEGAETVDATTVRQVIEDGAFFGGGVQEPDPPTLVLRGRPVE